MHHRFYHFFKANLNCTNSLIFLLLKSSILCKCLFVIYYNVYFLPLLCSPHTPPITPSSISSTLDHLTNLSHYRPIYTAKKSIWKRLCLIILFLSCELCACITCRCPVCVSTQARRVMWPTKRNDSPVFWEWAFTCKKTVKFLPAFKKTTLQRWVFFNLNFLSCLWVSILTLLHLNARSLKNIFWWITDCSVIS